MEKKEGWNEWNKDNKKETRWREKARKDVNKDRKDERKQVYFMSDIKSDPLKVTRGYNHLILDVPVPQMITAAQCSRERAAASLCVKRTFKRKQTRWNEDRRWGWRRERMKERRKEGRSSICLNSSNSPGSIPFIHSLIRSSRTTPPPHRSALLASSLH